MDAVPMPLRTLAWVACGFAFCVIVFGAFVRLSNAGLSCPDWPTCYGRITWPVQPAAVAKADQAFPQRPVETHKAWREQTHRFLAGTLGLLVLAQAVAATLARKRRLAGVIAGVVLIGAGIPLYMAQSYVASSVIAALGEALLLAVALFWRGGGWRRVAVLALAVVCFQALLGMWTVTWLLKPIVVSAHLLGGMATFALLAWIAWRQERGRSHVLSRDSVQRNAPSRYAPGPGFVDPGFSRLRTAAIVGLVLLACQIFLGGWTSSNYAALACGTGGAAFPTCVGQWWPAMDFHHGFILWRGIGVNFEGGILDASARTAIQMVHRIGALVVFVYTLWLAAATARRGLRRHALLLALAVVLQVALGIANVVLGLPLAAAVAHNGGAALLLFVLVALVARAQSLRSTPVIARPGQPAGVPVAEP